MSEASPAPCLLIFFHGHGSNALEIQQTIAPAFQKSFPNVELLFPEGPIQWTSTNGLHCSWFDVTDMPENQPDEERISQRAREAAKVINQKIDTLLRDKNLNDSQVILAGFSQGATMAYYTGLTREQPVGGVFSLSGGALSKLIDPVSKPPVSLHAGEKETHPYCGVPQVAQTHAFLEKNGFIADCVIFPDTGHSITPESIDRLLVFTERVMSHAFNSNNPEPPQNAPGKGNPKPPGFFAA